jgi:hypothetical protein
MNEFGKSIIQEPTSPLQFLDKLALLSVFRDNKKLEDFKPCHEMSFAAFLVKVIYNISPN